MRDTFDPSKGEQEFRLIAYLEKVRQAEVTKQAAMVPDSMRRQTNTSPEPSLPPSLDILKMTWAQFFNKVKSEFRINHGPIMPKRLEMMKQIKDIFRKHSNLDRMDLNERKAIAGLTDAHGWFGSMIGAGRFKKAIRENDRHLTEAFNRIPLAGVISKTQYLEFVEEFLKAFPNGGGATGTATRLLAMRRPDTFVCVNSGNKEVLCPAFGAPLSLYFEQYWDIIERMKKAPWYDSQEPRDDVEREVWNARAAFMDSAFYCKEDLVPRQEASKAETTG
jgi:hypothetical protein